ncbi:DUF4238 domain-containing protein [Caballeronia sp. LZ032]|uniref:DUF4238 domain-containing protein n=1 Tax=Caballeronia sp. LZ032 TaxID=3038565 RepID=UPI0028612237|nr:DUF4238 domain-containing protein [Caballeronia sp. LZ032]MDR5881927.1 DUF4238 domain-containing protein [Caballeronia sp. LZ032]
MHHIEQELPMYREIFPYLRDRQWRLWIAPENGGGFVTSDHPVSIVWQERPTVGSMLGFASPKSSLAFPLSRTMAIAGHFDAQGGTYVSALQIARYIRMMSNSDRCWTDKSRGTARPTSAMTCLPSVRVMPDSQRYMIASSKQHVISGLVGSRVCADAPKRSLPNLRPC